MKGREKENVVGGSGAAEEPRVVDESPQSIQYHQLMLNRPQMSHLGGDNFLHLKETLCQRESSLRANSCH